MIGLENKDSSFFTVESPDVTLKDNNFSKNVLSLTIDERMSALTTGCLEFYDPDDYYSRILRTGVTLKISWGYKKLDSTPDSLIAKKINFDEISGDLVRRGYQGFVSSPSGEGGQDGVKKYSCNFSAFGYRGDSQSKIYSSGTKKSVVGQAFDDIGISPTMRMIDFSLGNDKVTPDKYVRQDETTFAFLNRMAIEWQSCFHVSFSPAGEPVGFFIDNNKIGSTSMPAWVLAAGGASNAIGYKGELNNVKSYKWTSSESETGVGDNVRVDIVDGNIVFRRYMAKAEKVITYRLDQKKIQETYKKAADEGFGEMINITKELLSKNDFNTLLNEHYFIPVETTTAPNGYGYRIDCEMIGNPLYMPGNRIVIKNGFPDRLGGSQSIWYLRSVGHKIDRSGYMMSIEVVDVFNLSPIGLPVM